jgi:hypothetical protein
MSKLDNLLDKYVLAYQFGEPKNCSEVKGEVKKLIKCSVIGEDIKILTARDKISSIQNTHRIFANDVKREQRERLEEL